jgi:hypothetical protein
MERFMTGHKIVLRGYRLDKNGRPVKDELRLDVSTRLKRKASRKVRVVRRTVPR